MISKKECFTLFLCLHRLRIRLPSDVRILIHKYRSRLVNIIGVIPERKMSNHRQFMLENPRVYNNKCHINVIDITKTNKNVTVYLKVPERVIQYILHVIDVIIDSVPIRNGKFITHNWYNMSKGYIILRERRAYITHPRREQSHLPIKCSMRGFKTPYKRRYTLGSTFCGYIFIYGLSQPSCGHESYMKPIIRIKEIKI